jgi:ABC-2 type transport system permease protein
MLRQIVVTELIKLRRAKITWLTWLAFSVMPLAGGLFMWIAREPARAARLGLVGQKARLAGITADWPSYLALLNQQACVGGMLLLAIIAAYVFGREYSEETAKNMLVLPVPRQLFVLAKLVVIAAWFAALLLSLFGEGVLVGWALGLPGFSARLAAGSLGEILLSGAVGYLLVPVVTWIAALGKGYLAPIGFTIFMLVLGNVFGATGWGKWFPWSIVPMLAGMAGPRLEVLAPGSLAVVGATFAAGLAATILQLRNADNTQ